MVTKLPHYRQQRERNFQRVIMVLIFDYAYHYYDYDITPLTME